MAAFNRQLVTGVVFVVALLLTACGGGSGGGAGNQEQPPTNVGKAGGGTITDTSGARIDFPSNALMASAANVAISSVPLAGEPVEVEANGTAVAVSNKYSITQDSGLRFLDAVTITLPYELKNLDASSQLVAAYFDDTLGRWVPIANGLDDRANGKFTFNTRHFSLWSILKLSLQPNPPIWDTHFDPATDGIPFINFAEAIAPDGYINFPNGSCAGMSGLAGWFYQAKSTGQNALSSFPDSKAARNLVVKLSSLWNYSSKKTTVPNSVDSPSASFNLKTSLAASKSPVLVWINDGLISGNGSGNHFVLVYKYDDLGNFFYYDPNLPGVAKKFSTGIYGNLIDWVDSASKKPVQWFSTINVVGEFATATDIYSLYQSYLSEIRSGVDAYSNWGHLSGLAVNIDGLLLPTAIVSGNISLDARLSGSGYFVSFLVPKDSLKSPTSGFGADDWIQATDAQVPSASAKWFGIPAQLVGGDMRFRGTIPLDGFKPGAGVVLKIIVSTVDGNPFLGQWAYDEVEFTTPTLPNSQPTAAFTISPASASVNQAVLLDASGSVDSDGAITSYSWDFGDQQSAVATTATQSHSYVSSGSFTVKLTVTDNQGAVGVLSKIISVQPVQSVVPTISSISPTSMIANGTSQQLTINGANFLSSNVVQFKWASGNGANIWTNSLQTPGIGVNQIVVNMNPGSVTDSIAVRVCRSASAQTAADCSNEVFAVNVTPQTISSVYRINDTGAGPNQCYMTGSNTLVSCASSEAILLYAQQDGMTGRDVSNPENLDGKAGFSFSTIGNYPVTDCVKDNVSGLIWQGYSATGLRAGSNTYTNYSNAAVSTQAQIDALTNSVGFKNAVNAVGLCGYTDWRLPTENELQGLMDYSSNSNGLFIDATWFPSTPIQGAYWSATQYGNNLDICLQVYGSGEILPNSRDSRLQVRLVR